MRNLISRDTYLERRIQSLYALWLLFFLIISLKLIMVFHEIYGPTLFYDEFFYKDFTKSIFHYFSYDKIATPPLYPFILAPSFLFGDHFYVAMLVINILISSAMIFPVWFISRLFFNYRISFLLCVLSAILPFHLVFPRMLMSENLYYPLFLLTTYLVLKKGSGRKYQEAAILGFMLGLLELTRYISILVIPVFVIFWAIKRISEQDYSHRSFWKEMVILAGATIITILPWLFMAVNSGHNLFSAIGLGVSKSSPHINYTLSDLSMWTILYLSYIVMMFAPLFFSFLIGVKYCQKSCGLDTLSRFFLLIIGLTAFLSLASIRHSWLMDYNYPNPLRINGRYVTYVTVLYIILAFAIIKEVVENRLFISKSYYLFSLFTTFLTITIAYKILVIGDLYNLPSWFMLYFNAPSGYIFKLFHLYGLFYIMSFTIIVLLAMFLRKRHVFSLVFTGLFLMYISNDIIFFDKVRSQQSIAIHGIKMVNALSKDTLKYWDKTIIYNDLEESFDTFLYFSLKFWDIEENTFSIKKYDSLKSTDVNAIIVSKKARGPVLEKYTVEGMEYGIYFPMKSKKNSLNN